MACPSIVKLPESSRTSIQTQSGNDQCILYLAILPWTRFGTLVSVLSLWSLLVHPSYLALAYNTHPVGWHLDGWKFASCPRVPASKSERHIDHRDTFWVSLFCTSCIYSRRQGFLAREKQAGLLDPLAPSPPPPHHSCDWQFRAAKSEPANHKHWQILYIAGYRLLMFAEKFDQRAFASQGQKVATKPDAKALSSNPFQWWWMKQKPFNAQSPIALAIHKSSELLALWSQIFVTAPTLLTQPIHIRYNAPASSSLPSICYLVLPGQRKHKVVFIICSKQVSNRFCPNLQKACQES